MALNDKQTLFVEEYLSTFNATKAALAAGYSEKTAYSMGARLLKNVEISEIISQRLSETAMSADEVLRRLGEHARADMGDFWNIPSNGNPTLDLTSDKAKSKLHLIKKMKVKETKRFVKISDEETEPVVTTEIEFELYDSQAALEKLGRHHKLFTDKQEITGKDGGPVETSGSIAVKLVDYRAGIIEPSSDV